MGRYPKIGSLRVLTPIARDERLERSRGCVVPDKKSESGSVLADE
jgi:hypothetical protein